MSRVLIVCYDPADPAQEKSLGVIRDEVLRGFEILVCRNAEEFASGLALGYGYVAGVVFTRATMELIKQARSAIVGVRVVVLDSGVSPAIMDSTRRQFLVSDHEVQEYAPHIRTFLRFHVQAGQSPSAQGLPSG